MSKQIGDIRVYSIADIAKTLKVADITVRVNIKRGYLIAVKFGRSYMITEDSLSKFLNTRQRKKQIAKRRKEKRLKK